MPNLANNQEVLNGTQTGVRQPLGYVMTFGSEPLNKGLFDISFFCEISLR